MYFQIFNKNFFSFHIHSLGFILQIFIKFCKFQPQYSYKACSYEKRVYNKKDDRSLCKFCDYRKHWHISRSFLLKILVTNRGCGLSARTSVHPQAAQALVVRSHFLKKISTRTFSSLNRLKALLKVLIYANLRHGVPQATQALVVRSYFFLKKSLCERSARETSHRDIVTAVIYCYITTLRET